MSPDRQGDAVVLKKLKSGLRNTYISLNRGSCCSVGIFIDAQGFMNGKPPMKAQMDCWVAKPSISSVTRAGRVSKTGAPFPRIGKEFQRKTNRGTR